MPSHKFYYTGAVTQYYTISCRHTIFILQVLSHCFYSTVFVTQFYCTCAVTRYFLYSCRHTLLSLEVPSPNVQYTVAVTQNVQKTSERLLPIPDATPSQENKTTATMKGNIGK